MRPTLIKSEKDYEAALQRIDVLMSAPPGTPQADELDHWLLLVEAYEEEHHPILPPSPIDAILFRMEQQGLRRIDLIPFIGSKSRVSEVLSGKRPLSLSMIRRLHKGLGIPAEILLNVENKRRASPPASRQTPHPRPRRHARDAC